MGTGVQNAGSHRDHGDVVAHGPGVVQADTVEGAAGEVDGCDDVLQVIPHQHVVSSLDGHICARSNRNADVCLGQGWGVVDAVAHHGHDMSSLLKILHCSGK